MRTTLIIADQKHKKLKHLAFRKGKSIAELINFAIDSAYFSEEAESPPPFAQLRGICRGAHITDEEIEAIRYKLPKKLESL